MLQREVSQPGAIMDRATGATCLGIPLYYERYGERQAAAGHYSRVLRCREHVLPVVEPLLAWADSGAA